MVINSSCGAVLKLEALLPKEWDLEEGDVYTTFKLFKMWALPEERRFSHVSVYNLSEDIAIIPFSGKVSEVKEL
jgi:hypothetical protein